MRAHECRDRLLQAERGFSIVQMGGSGFGFSDRFHGWSREPRAIVSGDVGMFKVNNIQKGMLDEAWLWLQSVNVATDVDISY